MNFISKWGLYQRRSIRIAVGVILAVMMVALWRASHLPRAPIWRAICREAGRYGDSKPNLVLFSPSHVYGHSEITSYFVELEGHFQNTNLTSNHLEFFISLNGKRIQEAMMLTKLANGTPAWTTVSPRNVGSVSSYITYSSP